MLLQGIHYIISTIIVLLAVYSVFAAQRAMRRGLTKQVFYATLWALGFFAAARVLHVSWEFFELERTLGAVPETVEHLMYLAAYVLFVWSVSRRT